jgi:hypothetical protein
MKVVDSRKDAERLFDKNGVGKPQFVHSAVVNDSNGVYMIVKYPL